MVPQGMAMIGRTRSRAMVVLVMGMRRRHLRRMKVPMALVVIGSLGSQNSMARRHSVHMVMERSSPSIRVVGMRGQAMVGDRGTMGARKM